MAVSVSASETYNVRGRKIRLSVVNLTTTMNGATPETGTFELPIGTYAGSVVFSGGTFSGTEIITVRLTHGYTLLGGAITDTEFDIFNHAYDMDGAGDPFSSAPAPLFGGVSTPTGLDGGIFVPFAPSTDWGVSLVSDIASTAIVAVSITALSHVLEV